MSAGKRGLIRKALQMHHKVVNGAGAKDTAASGEAGASGALAVPCILSYDIACFRFQQGPEGRVGESSW